MSRLSFRRIASVYCNECSQSLDFRQNPESILYIYELSNVPKNLPRIVTILFLAALQSQSTSQKRDQHATLLGLVISRARLKNYSYTSIQALTYVHNALTTPQHCTTTIHHF